MDSSTWLLLSLVCYGIYSYLKHKFTFFERHELPSVSKWKILKNTYLTMTKRKHMFEAISENYNYNKDAKYIGCYDFTKPVIMLRDLDLIKTVTIKNFDNLPDRTSFIDDSVDPLFAGNLFNMAGERWREARNLLSPAFTGSKMKGMFELMVQCGENFISYLKNMDKAKLEMVDSKDLFTRYTNDVIATCAFGISVDSLNEPKNDFYVFGREATNFENFGFLLFILGRYAPRILKLLNIKFMKDHISEFFKDVIRRTIAVRDEKGIRRPDMIQLMMDARTKEHQHLKLDITEMTAQAFIFFFGGFETTSSQMSILAQELIMNQDIQARLQEEIDDVLEKNNGKVTYEAINEMTYMDAVFNESLRKHTQFGLLDRFCVKEIELPPALPGLKPFIVKPGMTVWIPSICIHRDPQYYENPETFDPERYLHKKVSINDVTNLGFGIGPRACIGNRFAIMETKILIFYILSKFNLKPNAKTSKTFKYDQKVFNLRPVEGYWMKMEPRSGKSAED